MSSTPNPSPPDPQLTSLQRLFRERAIQPNILFLFIKDQARIGSPYFDLMVALLSESYTTVELVRIVGSKKLWLAFAKSEALGKTGILDVLLAQGAILDLAQEERASEEIRNATKPALNRCSEVVAQNIGTFGPLERLVTLFGIEGEHRLDAYRRSPMEVSERIACGVWFGEDRDKIFENILIAALSELSVEARGLLIRSLSGNSEHAIARSVVHDLRESPEALADFIRANGCASLIEASWPILPQNLRLTLLATGMPNPSMGWRTERDLHPEPKEAPAKKSAKKPRKPKAPPRKKARR